MPDLNIRNVDKALIHRLKVLSAEAGVTLREYAIEKLGGEAGASDGKRGVAQPPFPRRVAEAPRPQGKVAGCKSCGSVGGLHQRGCKG